MNGKSRSRVIILADDHFSSGTFLAIFAPLIACNSKRVHFLELCQGTKSVPFCLINKKRSLSMMNPMNSADKILLKIDFIYFHPDTLYGGGVARVFCASVLGCAVCIYKWHKKYTFF